MYNELWHRKALQMHIAGADNSVKNLKFQTFKNNFQINISNNKQSTLLFQIKKTSLDALISLDQCFYWYIWNVLSILPDSCQDLCVSIFCIIVILTCVTNGDSRSSTLFTLTGSVKPITFKLCTV